MKDDLTNRIIGAVAAEGTPPLVVKVRPTSTVCFLARKLIVVVHELWRPERMPAIPSATCDGK